MSLTDNDLIALLRERARDAATGGYLSLAEHLRRAAEALDTHFKGMVMRTILGEHDANDYTSWLRCGKMLKATGYTDAFIAWKEWSEKSPAYSWVKLNEAWVSFPRAPEPQ